MKVCVGIDIGGSHIGIGILGVTGALLLKSDMKINGMLIMSEELISAINNLIRKNCNSTWEIASIGVGCPGQAHSGVIVAASNIPLVKNLHIVEKLGVTYGDIPIILVNDADAALAAEMWGTHKKVYADVKNAALLTLGTGVGCGLMLNGQLHQGSNGLIEAGHMIVSNSPHARLCGCGQKGCVEVYSSATNTALRLQEADKAAAAAAAGSSAGNNKFAPVVTMSVEAEEIGGTTAVFERYFNGDQRAIEVVEETVNHLATLCVNLCRVVDPEVIVFGGGMSNVGQPLLDLIQKHIDKKTWTVLPTTVRLTTAKSGSDSGIFGAALAAAQKLSLATSETAVDSQTTSTNLSKPYSKNSSDSTPLAAMTPTLTSASEASDAEPFTMRPEMAITSSHQKKHNSNVATTAVTHDSGVTVATDARISDRSNDNNSGGTLSPLVTSTVPSPSFLFSSSSLLRRGLVISICNGVVASLLLNQIVQQVVANATDTTNATAIGSQALQSFINFLSTERVSTKTLGMAFLSSQVAISASFVYSYIFESTDSE